MRRFVFIQYIEKFDIFLFKKIFNWHGKRWIDGIMRCASHIGNGYLYPIIGAVLAIINFKAFKKVILVAVISFVIEGIIYAIIKLKFKRTRPCDLIPGVENRTKMQDPFSFPSGHTAAAFVMATVFRSFYPHLSIPLYLFALTVGISRVYNGLHFPSDILVGGFLGFMSARLSILILV